MTESDGRSFTDWLDMVGQRYQSLTSRQRNQTLDHLIAISKGSQLYHLSQILNVLLKRDFIADLPLEISYKILNLLGAEQLLACRHVSKCWTEVIDGCVDVWRRVCEDSGIVVREDNHDAAYWRNKYLRCRQRLDLMKSGRSFKTRMIFGHTDRVMALYYYDGLLATGSDDHSVRIWECSTGQCLKILKTHTVAEIKFNRLHIFTASFDTTAICWDFSSGKSLQQYVGHVAAVFSVDYSTPHDLVITGSADSTVKIWQLSTGELIQTMPQHRSNWIMQVRLIAGRNCYHILSRDNVSIYTWTINAENYSILKMEEWQKHDYNLVPCLQIKQTQVNYAVVGSENRCYVLQTDLNEIGQSHQERLSCKVAQDSLVQAFLGSGQVYDVILTQGDTASIDIVRHLDKVLVSSTRLPSDYRQSKRMSTFMLGEIGWLDGLDGHNDNGVFFVTSLRDNSILLLEWQPLD